MLESAKSEQPGYLTVKLFWNNSSLCDHNPSTLQTVTDGQTVGERRRTYYCNTV